MLLAQFIFIVSLLRPQVYVSVPIEAYDSDRLNSLHALAAYDPKTKMVILPDSCEDNDDAFCTKLRQHELSHHVLNAMGVGEQHKTMVRVGVFS